MCVSIWILIKQMNKEQNAFLTTLAEYLDSDKRFFVQSEDYTGSKQILTAEFIEKLDNLRKTLDCSENMWCKFQDNQITMFFNTVHSMFEIGSLNKPMSGTNQITPFLKDLTAITDIIDYFKLNEKTGL